MKLLLGILVALFIAGCSSESTPAPDVMVDGSRRQEASVNDSGPATDVTVLPDASNADITADMVADVSID